MTVIVVHGANTGRFDGEGQTVSCLARYLRDVFNLPPNASSFVNGKSVSQSHILASGDDLEFVRTFGHKGGFHNLYLEEEVKILIGPNAVSDMAAMDILPIELVAYTQQQVSDYLRSLDKGPVGIHNHSPFIVDFGSMTMTYGSQGPFSIKETLQFRLLKILALRPGHYVDIQTLKVSVWNDPSDTTDDETINRVARQLRRTLRELGLNGVSIEGKSKRWALILS